MNFRSLFGARSPVGLLVAAVAAAFAASPALAAPAWTPLGAVAPHRAGVHLAVNPSGAMVALLQVGTRLDVRSGSVRSGLGPARTLATGTISSRVALGPDGTAVAAWTTRIPVGVEVSVRPPGGRWSRSQLLSVEGTFHGGTTPDIAIDDKGNAIVSWKEDGPDYYVARVAYRPAGGSFGTPVDLSPRTTTPQAGAPKVAMSADGEAIAVWGQELPAGGVQSEAVMYSIGRAGTWAPATQVSEVPSDALVLSWDVTIADSGEALVVWTELPHSMPAVVKAAIRPPGGGFGPAGVIGTQRTTDVALGVELAADRRGNAVAVWLDPRGLDRVVPHVARRLAGTNVWQPFPRGVPALTVPRIAALQRIGVAVSPRGGMVLSWSVIAGRAYGVVRALVMPIRGRIVKNHVQTVARSPLAGTPTIEAVALGPGRAFVAVDWLKTPRKVTLFGRPT